MFCGSRVYARPHPGPLPRGEGESIAVAGDTLALWDRQSRSLIRSNSFPRYNPESYPRLAFSPDGERVAWVTGDALRIMRVESGEISATAIDGTTTLMPSHSRPTEGCWSRAARTARSSCGVCSRTVCKSQRQRCAGKWVT